MAISPLPSAGYADPYETPDYATKKKMIGVQGEAVDRMRALLSDYSKNAKVTIFFDNDTGGYTVQVEKANPQRAAEIRLDIETLFKNDAELNGILAKYPDPKDGAPAAPQPETPAYVPPGDLKFHAVNGFGDTVELSTVDRELELSFNDDGGSLNFLTQFIYTGPIPQAHNWINGINKESMYRAYAEAAAKISGKEYDGSLGDGFTGKQGANQIPNNLTFSRYSGIGEVRRRIAGPDGQDAQDADHIMGERQTLQARITMALKRAGIKLDKDEPLKLDIGKDGKIVVGSGDPDNKTAKHLKIEEVLNNTPGLAESLYVNGAAGKGSAGDYAAKKVLMDDFLKEKIGVGLSGLGYGPDGILDPGAPENAELVEFMFEGGGNLGTLDLTMLIELNQLIAFDGEEHVSSFTFTGGELRGDEPVASSNGQAPTIISRLAEGTPREQPTRTQEEHNAMVEQTRQESLKRIEAAYQKLLGNVVAKPTAIDLIA